MMAECKRVAMRVVLVEDHQATREEVRALIEREPDLHVVAEAATGEEGIHQVRTERPDVVVMDILLPGMNGGCKGTDTRRPSSAHGGAG